MSADCEKQMVKNIVGYKYQPFLEYASTTA